VSTASKSVSPADGAAPLKAADVRPLFAHLAQYPALILAVSGGPDSTALMVLAQRWCKMLRCRPKLVAVTVDHGLRPEAKREAAAVKALARSLGIQHQTMRWTGPKPKTGLQEAARDARYRLLADASRAEGGAPVLTAHTRDDQAETVLFRMMRGSGIGGLAGMRRGTLLPGQETTDGSGKIELFRPLLDVPKSRLIATLEAAKIRYADDPSNRDPRFARPRLRKLMHLLAAEGLTATRLAKLADRASRAETALDDALRMILRELAPPPWPERGAVTIDTGDFYRLADELKVRVLRRVVDWAGDEGPVELGKLEKLCASVTEAIEDSHVLLGKAPRYRHTLAGALISVAAGQLRIERAPARRRTASKRP
jgi:tRNA(Ile)-lysidine synthase